MQEPLSWISESTKSLLPNDSFPLSGKSIPALVYLMPNAAFPNFLQILGFLLGEVRLENLSRKDITVALELPRGLAWPWAPRNAPHSPLLQPPRGKPSVPLGKGFASTRSPPPASRLRPQLPCFDEHWGNESPAFKNTLLLFRWKEESCLPTLTYKNRLSVSKSSKFLLVHISSLAFFF